jgi:hypothetical protein
MRTRIVVATLALAACAHPRAPAPPAAAGAAPAAACAAPEFRQLDFWVGDWDVVVKARQAPDSDAWAEAPGTQHIEKILGGCAIAEHFSASGPGPAWAGASYSMWQPQLGKWRQTWVDDQGSFLEFEGGVDAAGTMALYGPPRAQKDGTLVQMRMIWLDVGKDALRWEWQRSVDAGKSWSPMMIIAYRRRA